MCFPFIQKYKFVFNYNTNIIGFYNPDFVEDKNDESNVFDVKYVRLIIEISITIILVIVAFFVAKKIYEQRKKRANELTDDNYYYTSKNEEEEQSRNRNSLGV